MAKEKLTYKLSKVGEAYKAAALDEKMPQKGIIIRGANKIDIKTATAKELSLLEGTAYVEIKKENTSS